eukprot:1290475-Alexandrium_andersonii.AAC.1
MKLARPSDDDERGPRVHDRGLFLDNRLDDGVQELVRLPRPAAQAPRPMRLVAIPHFDVGQRCH